MASVKFLLVILSMTLTSGFSWAKELHLDGAGSLILREQQMSGGVRERQFPCKLSMTLAKNKSHLTIQGPIFDCDSLDQWQDGVFDFKISRGLLYDADGGVQGSITTGGDLEFSIHGQGQDNYNRIFLGADCKVDHSESVTLTTSFNQHYILKKSGAGYALIREFQGDSIRFKRTPESPQCPAVIDPIVLQNAADVQGNLTPATTAP